MEGFFNKIILNYIHLLYYYLVHGNLNFVNGHLILNVIVKKFVQYGIKFH